jgi:hypothetical protein
VVKNAISEGFEVNEHQDLETILCDAENHLFSKCKHQKFEHCTLNSDGSSQYYYFIDKDGNEFNSTGEIFDFGKYKAEKEIYFKFEDGKFIPVNWFDIPMEGEERSDYVFVFDTIIDCDGEIVALYDCFE